MNLQSTRDEVERILTYRVRRAMGRYGVRGSLSRVGELAWEHVAYSASHVWYDLDLTGPRPRPPLGTELTLRVGIDQDLALLEQFPTIGAKEARRRFYSGNNLWVVLDGEQPLFSCWILREGAPAIAAPGGEVKLPADTVCLEDSVTAAAARGRGIAPAAWAAIADALVEEGKHHMITKVRVNNIPSRRAVEKVGFAAVSIMHFRRTGLRSQTWVEPMGGTHASFFARQAA